MSQNGQGQHAFSAVFNFALPKIEERVNKLMVEMEGPEKFYGSMGTADSPKKAFKQYNYVTNHIYNVSFGSIAASGEKLVSDRPTIGTATTVVPDFGTAKGVLRPTVQYARMTLSIPELVLDGLDAESALGLFVARGDDQAEVLSRVDNSSWWGDGSGAFGEVQAAASSSATTIKLKRDDQISYRYAGKLGAERAWVNRTFRPYRNGAVVGTSAYMITDVQPDPGAGVGDDNGYDTITITPALADALQPGDLLVDADATRTSWGKWPNGFGNMYDDGTVAPFFMGYDRLAEPLLGLLPELHFTTTGAEGVASHFQRLTVPLLQRAMSAYQKKHQRGMITFCGTSEVMDQIPWETLLTDSGSGVDVNAESSVMSSQRQGSAGGDGQLNLGNSGFRVFHPRYARGGVKFITDDWATKSLLMGFEPKDLDRCTWEPWKIQSGFLGKPSGGYYPNADEDTAQIRWRGMKNRTTRQPQRCVIIDRIRQQTDVVRFA